MKIYILAQLKFTDMEAYQRYLKQFPAIFQRFDARVLASDTRPEVLEGDWRKDKVVLLEFASDEEARRFETDPDYQRIAQDRRAGAEAIILRVRGLKASLGQIESTPE
ncbi:MAG: DUF1330 domain-containing protein [Vulcanimicrobiota bacterium]